MDPNFVRLNYQVLGIDDENNLKIGWTAINKTENCGTSFRIEGFILSSLMNNEQATPVFDPIIENSTTTKILPDQRRVPTGESIVYRIMALNQEGEVCSDSSDNTTYYEVKGKLTE